MYPDAAKSDGIAEPQALEGPDAVTAAGFTLFFLGVLVGIAGARSRRDPDLGRGEVVLYRSQPRRSVARYALSLGVWELTRRTTSFVVTQRRLIVESGVIRRRTHSIPLRGIVDVDVVAGPWEGIVKIAERGGDPDERQVLGPLRAPAARMLASTLTRAIDAR